MYSYLTDDTYEDKKSKRHKKYVIKRKLKFEDQTHCLEANQLENKANNWKKINKMQINNKSIPKLPQIFRIEKLNVFTEEVNKIQWCSQCWGQGGIGICCSPQEKIKIEDQIFKF